MAGKLGRALVLLVLLAAALITQAPLAVFLLAFALVLLVLLRLDAAYLRRQVTAELLVPDKPVIQGEDFTLTVRLSNRSRLPIPALVVLLNAADEWGGGQITLRCAECKQRNYVTNKNKKNTPDRLELNKYCPFCRKHTVHNETK